MTEETWVKHPVAFKIEIRGVVSVEHPEDEDATDYLTAYYCKGRYFMSDVSAAEALIRDAGNDNIGELEAIISRVKPQRDPKWRYFEGKPYQIPARPITEEDEDRDHRRAAEDEAQQFRDHPYGRD